MENLSGIFLDWYDRNKRQLPWRETRDPYLIWVSEIILQQTRVAQGLEYYLRFIRRFPDVATLASASEEEVLKYWQGLGYYSRARNLHTAARSIIESGTFPRTYEGVRALKGVGDYTAAAICSSAFNLPYAAVDGNVYRVLSRLMGLDTPIDSPIGKREFASLAGNLLDKTRPGDFNQALMDFGATLCTPRSPQCGSCPFADVCVAFREDRVESLPVKQHRVKTTDRYFNYMYVRAGHYTFINKRSGNDIWHNLYELPLVESDSSLTEEEFYRHPEVRTLVETFPDHCFRPLCHGVRHVLSHRVIHADFYELQLPPESISFGSCLRIREEELDDYPFSQLIVRFLERYLER